MRFPPLTADVLTARQRKAAHLITSRSNGALRDPYLAMLCAPEVAELAHHLGHYLEFDLRLPERLRVVALLQTAARHGSQDARLFSDLSGTRDSGLSSAKIASLANGDRPTDLDDDESLVFDFCSALNLSGRVTTETFRLVSDRFGREMCIELLTLCGYVAFLTTIMNVTETRIIDA